MAAQCREDPAVPSHWSCWLSPDKGLCLIVLAQERRLRAWHRTSREFVDAADELCLQLWSVAQSEKALHPSKQPGQHEALHNSYQSDRTFEDRKDYRFAREPACKKLSSRAGLLCSIMMCPTSICTGAILQGRILR